MICGRHRVDVNECTHGFNNIVVNNKVEGREGWMDLSTGSLLKSHIIANKLLKKNNKSNYKSFYGREDEIDKDKCTDLGFAKLSVVTPRYEALAFDQELFRPTLIDINENTKYTQVGNCLNIEEIPIKLPSYTLPIEHSRYYTKN